MLPIFRAGPALADLGLMRQAVGLANRLRPLPLTERERRSYVALMATPKAATALRNEAVALYSLCDSSKPMPSLGDKPLIVLSASLSIGDDFPPECHIEMAKLSTNGVRRVVPNTGHSGIVLRPGPAAVSAAAILEVVDSVRARGR